MSKNGGLIIQYANDSEARRYLREEIRYIESKEFKINQKQAEKEIYEAIRFDWEKQRQLYMPSMRGIKESIPKEVVDEFDLCDEGDLSDAPRFTCQNCGGEMYSEYYKSTHDVEYKLSDYQK